MRILLTGADGFTGRHFAQIAASSGHEITPLASDLRDKNAVRTEVGSARYDAVVHLAAISFVGHEEPASFYDVNLFGTLNLLEALAATGQSPRTLLVSSANIYGNSPNSPISESQPPAPVNHYAMSKLAMEFMTRQYAARFPIILARPFNYIGPGQDTSFVVPKLVQHFVRREPFVELGKLDVRREFNDVRFVCDTYLRLLAPTCRPDTYNICTGVTHDLAQVIDCLERITGHTMEVRMNPQLIRANEIDVLCGDPAQLRAAIGALPVLDLPSTIGWMVENYQAQRDGIA